MSNRERGVTHFSVNLPIEGYDVTVRISSSAIERELRRAEERGGKEYAQSGPTDCDLSRFVTVCAEPTHEKWGELIDDAE